MCALKMLWFNNDGCELIGGLVMGSRRAPLGGCRQPENARAMPAILSMNEDHDNVSDRRLQAGVTPPHLLNHRGGERFRTISVHKSFAAH